MTFVRTMASGSIATISSAAVAKGVPHGRRRRGLERIRERWWRRRLAEGVDDGRGGAARCAALHAVGGRVEDLQREPELWTSLCQQRERREKREERREREGERASVGLVSGNPQSWIWERPALPKPQPCELRTHWSFWSQVCACARKRRSDPGQSGAEANNANTGLSSPRRRR